MTWEELILEVIARTAEGRILASAPAPKADERALKGKELYKIIIGFRNDGLCSSAIRRITALMSAVTDIPEQYISADYTPPRKPTGINQFVMTVDPTTGACWLVLDYALKTDKVKGLSLTGIGGYSGQSLRIATMEEVDKFFQAAVLLGLQERILTAFFPPEKPVKKK